MFIVLLFCSFCPALVSRRTLGLSLEKARCELSQPHPTPARPLGQTPSKGFFGPLSPPVPQTFDPSRIWVNLISVPGPLVQFSTVFVKHLILILSSAHPWYPLSNASVGIFLLLITEAPMHLVKFQDTVDVSVEYLSTDIQVSI